MVDRTTLFLIAVLVFPVSSSKEKPVIKVKYAGISGNIQGEKKDRRPARNAVV